MTFEEEFVEGAFPYTRGAADYYGTGVAGDYRGEVRGSGGVKMEDEIEGGRHLGEKRGEGRGSEEYLVPLCIVE